MNGAANQHDHVSWLSEEELRSPVGRLLGDDVSSVVHWTCHRTVSGGGDELGVWKVTGSATLGGVARIWSMFLKGWAPPDADADSAHWDWPDRERYLYRSGLLDHLPGGLTAPKALGETERDDGSAWLWLEGVIDHDDGRWSLENYAHAARALGEMNGAFLGSRALPVYPWLSRGWLRQWVEAAAPAIRDLERSADHPLVQRVLPPPVAGTFIHVWNAQHDYLALLDALPQTFCHLDAFRRNLFMKQRSDGTNETVAIDWGFAGIAALGEEIAPLVAASLFFGDLPAEDAQRLEDTVLAGYTEGLEASGWQGDPELVRTGYVISVALRYGVGTLRGELFYLPNEQNHPVWSGCWTCR